MANQKIKVKVNGKKKKPVKAGGNIKSGGVPTAKITMIIKNKEK